MTDKGRVSISQEMLPQPPPNAEAPPPSEAALLSRRKWEWLVIVGVISIVICLIGLTWPIVIRSKKNPNQTEAISNARQIGMALFEFELEYGKFPDASTTAAVRKKSGTSLLLTAKTSNSYMRQLIASGFIQSESVFFAEIAGTRKPDNWIEGTHALEKGECGFSYLAGLSSEGNPSRPLLVTPLIPGTDRFDPTKFDGKAIVLKMDNSVTSMNIDKSGHVMVFGKNLLDPMNPIWSPSDKWSIAWPEF